MPTTLVGLAVGSYRGDMRFERLRPVPEWVAIVAALVVLLSAMVDALVSLVLAGLVLAGWLAFELMAGRHHPTA